METLIVPAIIAKKQQELDWMLDRVQGIAKRVQLDVMDGEFVPNTSLNFDFTLDYRFEYEAHLMVTSPLDWIRDNSDRVNITTVHVESLKDARSAIDYVREFGVKVNLALIPNTEIASITPFLGMIDGVLVMTVQPGSYCVKKEIHSESLEKVRELRAIDDSIPIEVDGCMNLRNARLARDAGANIFVSGSYVFKSDNIQKAIRALEDAVK